MELREVSVTVGALEEEIKKVRIMLYPHRIRMLLEELIVIWKELTLQFESLIAPLQREFSQTMLKDPISAWVIMKRLEQAEKIDIQELLENIKVIGKEFLTTAGKEYPQAIDINSIADHAQHQIELAKYWINYISVVEHGEEGKPAWLLHQEEKVCNRMRGYAARTLAHIQLLTYHPYQYATLVEHIKASFDKACSWEEDVLLLKEVELEKKAGTSVPERPRFIS